MDQVKLCKGCLPQILLGPFLNTLSQISVEYNQAVAGCEIVTSIVDGRK